MLLIHQFRSAPDNKNSFCDFFDFETFKKTLLCRTDNTEIKNAKNVDEIFCSEWLNKTIGDYESQQIIEEYLNNAKEEFLWFWNEKFKEFHVYKV